MVRTIWQIENYDEGTRREIRIFAITQGITIAEALKRIVAEWKAARRMPAE